MKAIVRPQYGSPDVLKLEEIQKPTPGDNEVLVKVRAGSANAADWRFLRADPFLVRLDAGLPKPKNKILRFEVAGRVEAVGVNVKEFQPGDEVFGDILECRCDAFREHISVADRLLRRLLLDLRDETGDGRSAMNQIHPRYQHTLDDLFLQVFVLIDDFLQPFEPQLPSQTHQKASISEILTIAIVGEILAQPFESVWYWLVTQNHQDLFPSLPHPSRYHRILRNSERLIAQLALSVTGEQQGVKLIDSKPLPVAKGKRASWAKLPEAEKGFSTMGMVFGFKLHALVSEAGLFRRWLFAPASCSDVRAGRELTQDLEGDRVLGDKAYVGSDVITPARKNMHDQGIWCLWMSRARVKSRLFCSFLQTSQAPMSSSNSAGSTNQLISKYRFPESHSSLVSIHNAVTNRKQDSRFGKILTTRVLRLIS